MRSKAADETTARERAYYVWTVGCQMNISDSARLESALCQAGYRRAERPEEASFIVLNSCSVRASAEQRVIGKLGELQRIKHQYPETIIVLWGCMVGPNNTSPFREQLPMVDYFVSPSDLNGLLRLVPNLASGCPTGEQAEPVRPLPLHGGKVPPVSGFVPIQYGCNMACSYCVIPQRRGRARSRPMGEIVEEAQRLVELGTKEIILLGQIVDAWGYDLPEKPTLTQLLRAVHELRGLLRLRFLTSHPAWMSRSLIATIAELPRCQPEINLPVQSGSNTVLRYMRRGYTIEQYRAIIQTIREYLPGCALSTDIIVGHPGETPELFEETLMFVEQMRFDKIHIAAFSARPGTDAAELEQNPALAVAPWEKQARRQRLEALQERIATEINAALLGSTVEVLVESLERGKWRGRSGTNKIVFFEAPGAWRGQIVPVRITRTSPWSLQGQLQITSEDGMQEHARGHGANGWMKGKESGSGETR